MQMNTGSGGGGGRGGSGGRGGYQRNRGGNSGWNSGYANGGGYSADGGFSRGGSARSSGRGRGSGGGYDDGGSNGYNNYATYNGSNYNGNGYSASGGNSSSSRGRGRGRGRGRSSWGGRGGAGGGSSSSSHEARPPLPSDLEFVTTLKGHTKKVTCLSLDVPSGRLFSGSHDGTVRVWSASGGECLSTLEIGAEVDCLLLEGQRLFVGAKTPQGQGGVVAIDAVSGARADAPGHVGQVLALAFAGGLLFSAGQDRTIRAWRIQDHGTGPAGMGQPAMPAMPAGMVPGQPAMPGAMVPAAGAVPAVAPVLVPCGALGVAEGGHEAPVSCLLSSEGVLFSADFNGTIKVWDAAAGRLLQTVPNAHGGTYASAVTELLLWQGHVISAGLDGCIKIWQPAAAAGAPPAAPGAAPVVDPTPAFVLRGGEEEGAAASARPPARAPRADPPGVLALAGTADPRNRAVLMASMNGERAVRLYELPTFADRGTLADVANARALAGGGGVLFSGDERGHVRVWRWKA